MNGKQAYRLGNLQLRIMKVLWSAGKANVAQVQEMLDDALAYTTVATMLRKMEDRGLVRHQQEERRFIYEPAVSEETVTRSMSGELVDRLFGGSLAETVTHLLQTREVKPEELDRLEALIRAKKRQS